MFFFMVNSSDRFFATYFFGTCGSFVRVEEKLANSRFSCYTFSVAAAAPGSFPERYFNPATSADVVYKIEERKVERWKQKKLGESMRSPIVVRLFTQCPLPPEAAMRNDSSGL